MHGGVGVGEVHRFVQAHLHGTDGFAHAHLEEHLASGVCRREAREDERIDRLALQLVEGVLRVAQFLVERHVHLHFAIEHVVRELFVNHLHGVAGLVGGTAGGFLVATEVRVAEHRHHRFVGEEADGVVRELDDIHKRVGIGVAVHERIGQEERSLAGAQDMHGAEVLVFRTDTDDFLREFDGFGVLGIAAGNERVGVAHLHHHHAEVVRFEHVVAGFFEGHAVAAVFFGIDFGVLATAFEFLGRTRVHNLDAREIELFLVRHHLDAFGVAKQNRVRHAFDLRLHGGLEHVEVGTFGEHHALRVAAGGIAELADELVVVAHHVAELVVVGVPVGNRLAGHTAFDSGLSDGDRNVREQARIQRLRNQVFLAEGEALGVVGDVHHVGHRLVREGGNRTHGGMLHVFVDAGGTYVQGSAEDVGETDDVVHLVRIVTAARRKNQVTAARHGFFVADFGSRVRECEDDRLVGHAADHFTRQDVALRKAHEHVGALHGVFERFDVGAVGRKEGLRFGKALAVFADHALAVAHHEVFLLETQRQVESRAGASGCTRTVHHHFHVTDALARDFDGVEQARRRNDGRTVLVVVHHGDVEFGLQRVFDFEAFRSLDVFEVDAAERRGDSLHDLDELLRVFFVDFDIENVDTGVNLEQERLAFHHRLAREGADVTEAEHCGAVRNHGDEVALARVFVGEVIVLFDFQTGGGHTRRVSKSQVRLRAVRLGRHDFDLAGLTHGVIF